MQWEGGHEAAELVMLEQSATGRGTSGYVGVKFSPWRGGKWLARGPARNGRRVHLGYFDTALEAARARQRALPEAKQCRPPSVRSEDIEDLSQIAWPGKDEVANGENQKLALAAVADAGVEPSSPELLDFNLSRCATMACETGFWLTMQMQDPRRGLLSGTHQQAGRSLATPGQS